MVTLGRSSSGKPSKDAGGQGGVAVDSVPLISPLDIGQLQPPFADQPPAPPAPQVVVKTQEPPLSADPATAPSDPEARKLGCGHPEEARKLPTARTIALAMALLGCVLVMYKAIWYDQVTCPDGFLLRQPKTCAPLTLEMYFTEPDPQRHRGILAALGAYPPSRERDAQPPAWGARAAKGRPEPAPAPAAPGERRAARPSAAGDTAPAPQ